MFEIDFTPWPTFTANRDKAVDKRWLSNIQKEGVAAFKAGINGPHTGNIGRRKGGGTFIRSAAGEYPARDSGDLLRSLKGQSDQKEAVIGTNVEYSKYLRLGTGKMARRKMSDNALKDGIQAAPAPIGWVKFAKGKS
jgi:phage gpG-like protein